MTTAETRIERGSAGDVLGRSPLGEPADPAAEDRDEESRGEHLKPEHQEAGGEDQRARVGEYVVARPFDRQIDQLGEGGEHQQRPESAYPETEADRDDL